MFLNNAIHNFIRDKTTGPIVKKGADLMKFGFVSQLQVDQKSKTVTAIVKDIYKVGVNYQNAFSISEVNCKCGKNVSCEHVIATLYKMLSVSDEELQIVNLPASNKTEKEFSNNVAYRLNSLLQEGPSNEFKRLPFVDKESLNNFIDSAIPYLPKIYSAYTHSLDLSLSNKGELIYTILVKSKNNYWNENIKDQKIIEAQIIFKLENEEIAFRCTECTSISDRLCIHQFVALKDKNLQLTLLNKSWFPFNQIVENLAKKEGLLPGKFLKLFSINYENGKPNAKLSDINFYSKDKLFELKSDIDNLASTKQEVKDLFIENLTQETPNHQANAIIWFSHLDQTIPSLVVGNTNKSRDKLSSSIIEVTEPRFLNDQQSELWKTLNYLSKQHDNVNQNLIIKPLTGILKNNVSILQSIIHYFDTEENSYGSWNKKSLLQFHFSENFVDLHFHTKQDEWFIYTKMLVKIGDQLFDPQEKDFYVTSTFIILNHKAYLYQNEHVLNFFLKFDKNEIITDIDNIEDVVENLKYLNQFFSVKYPENFQPNIVQLDNPQWELYLKEAGNNILIKPILNYENSLQINIPLDQQFYLNQTNENTNLYEVEEGNAENYLQFLLNQNAGFQHSFQNFGIFILKIQDFVKGGWFLEFFEACRNIDIQIFGQDDLKNFKFNTHSATISMGISSGIDWFDVNVDIQFGHQKVKTKNWIEAIRNNEKYVLLDDGSIGLIPEEWVEKLKKIALIATEEKDKLQINKFNFNIVDVLFSELADDQLRKEIKQKVKKVSNYEFDQSYTLPNIVTADLRDYQVLGFQWLKTLSELGLGGCLADDMGLGKTLQVISLLADQKLAKKGTSLVIVPRSLLFNWAAEIDKFCPSLQYLNYHGSDRSLKKEQMLNYDMVITTYDTATNDIEIFREINFNYIILDESQAIKNPTSKRYKAMRLLQAKNRVVMTGTPIENNTFDLYAQFSFINPGIFGSTQSFKNNFSIAIDKNGDQEAAHMLRKIVHPFLLRRTKAQVATDLPDRTENIIYCEMDAVQRSYYETLRLQIKMDIENNISKEGFNKVRFKIIEGLLRLRQVCNSPALVDPSLPHSQKKSVKIETLVDIIHNDLGTHNALIFSQFTSMLALVRKELDKSGIKYAYLDGSTKDRKAAVEYFEKNDDVHLFLISLKAGNTGLNLIKADYVYILDPWWNPAVEAQAIDRTHRIGQTKNIFAYKMICKNTIEEKILKLQEKKKQLATDIIVTDENVFKSLDKNELMALFQ